MYYFDRVLDRLRQFADVVNADAEGADAGGVADDGVALDGVVSGDFLGAGSAIPGAKREPDRDRRIRLHFLQRRVDGAGGDHVERVDLGAVDVHAAGEGFGGGRRRRRRLGGVLHLVVAPGG